MDTRRLILVLIFTFSSFMLWESWQKYNQPKPSANASAETPAGSAAPQPTAALHAGTPNATVPTAAAAPAVALGETFTVTTDLVKATVSAQGGDIIKLELLKYKEHDNKEKIFDLFDGKHKYQAQSGLIGEGLPTHRTVFRRAAGPSQLAEGADEVKIRLEADAGNAVKVAKTLTFKRGSYVIDVAWEITNAGEGGLHDGAVQFGQGWCQPVDYACLLSIAA